MADPKEDSQVTRTSMRLGDARPRDPRTAARLVVLSGDSIGRRITIDAEILIGRSSQCEVMVEDNLASRRHARIRHDASRGFVLEDLMSRNGTMVNGVPVTERVLQYGDRIQVGSSLFLFTHYDPLEDEVAQRQKLESLGRLGAGIAHDFNNLIGAIAASVQFLDNLDRARTLEDPMVRECLKDIRTAATRATEVTRRLLGFARRTQREHGTVDVSELVSEVVQLISRIFDRSIRISTNVSPGLRVSGDRVALHQLLMNLSINARDAMPRGGVLRIDVRKADESDLDGLHLPRHGQYVLITVLDTGVGMDDETARRAFDPFFTTKSGEAGAGLGLSTVYDVSVSHGGHVDVRSKIGEGTKFRVFLPLGRADRREGADTGEGIRRQDTVRARAPVSILLVDDEDVVRKSAARILTHAGHRVTQARDGYEAVQVYREAQQRPDLVLLDINMPNLGGADTFLLLRGVDPNVRVVFVSGYWEREFEMQMRHQGALGFVQKPFDADVLLDTVQQAMQLATT